MKNIFSFFKKLDFHLVFIPLFLSLIGLVEIYSVSKGDFLNLKKQIFFLIVGMLLMLLISFIDWRFLRENPFLILSFYFLSILSLFFLYFFPPTRGVRGWYRFGVFSFEPVEIAKVSLLLLFSRYFSLRHTQLYDLRHILISFLYLLPLATLVFFQPDFGSFLILFFLWIAILLFSGIRLRHFFILCFIFLLLFGLSFEKILKPYQKERVLTFLKLKTPDPLKVGWSQNQAKIALGSGGLFGKGIKKGSQVQLGFLPEPHTDFIFSAIGEEMGFLGILVLFLLYVLLFWKILKIGFLPNSNFAKLLSGGYLAILFSQIFLHVGSNLGILPVVGISLPFVSYGGSNLISNFLVLGILQSIKTHA